MQGTQTTGYSGTNLDLKDRNIPVQLSPNQNAAVVEFKWSDNFPDFDPTTKRYSLSISPLVQRSQTFYFTIDVPTEGPVEVWGKSLKDGNLTSFGKFENFTLLSSDFQRILFAIDFDRWTINLESQDMSGSIPLPTAYRSLNLSGLDLGLSQIPKNTSFIDAMNTGTGTYSANFQKVDIGSKSSPSAATGVTTVLSTPMTSSPSSIAAAEAAIAEAPAIAAVKMTGLMDEDEDAEEITNVEQNWDQVHSSMLEGAEQPVAQPSGHPQLVIFILLALLIFFLVMMSKK